MPIQRCIRFLSYAFSWWSRWFSSNPKPKPKSTPSSACVAATKAAADAVKDLVKVEKAHVAKDVIDNANAKVKMAAKGMDDACHSV